MVRLPVLLHIVFLRRGRWLRRVGSEPHVEARKALAMERQRRTDWRKRELSARSFQAALRSRE